MEDTVNDEPKTRTELREDQQVGVVERPTITPMVTVTRADIARDTYVPAPASGDNPRPLELANRAV